MNALTRHAQAARLSRVADPAGAVSPLHEVRLLGITPVLMGHQVATFVATGGQRVELSFMGTDQVPHLVVDGAAPRAATSHEMALALVGLGRELAAESHQQFKPRDGLRGWAAQLDATYQGPEHTAQRGSVQRAADALRRVADAATVVSLRSRHAARPPPATAYPGLGERGDPAAPRLAYSRASGAETGDVSVVGRVEGARQAAQRDLQIEVLLSPDGSSRVRRHPWGRTPEAPRATTDDELAAFLRLSVQALAPARPLGDHNVLWRVDAALADLAQGTLEPLRTELVAARAALLDVLMPRRKAALEGGFDATQGTAKALPPGAPTQLGTSNVGARIAALQERT